MQLTHMKHRLLYNQRSVPRVLSDTSSYGGNRVSNPQFSLSSHLEADLFFFSALSVLALGGGEMAIPRMFDSNTPFVIVTGGS